MAEQPLDAVIHGKILQMVARPFGRLQDNAWMQKVNAAYQTLSHTPAFHTVLEHWTETVLLKEEADPGARAVIIEILRSMNAVNQRDESRLDREGRPDGW